MTLNNHHSHKFSYDESERRSWQNPKEILADSGLKRNQVLADIGCNVGFFSIPAARIVGAKGHIYGLDINSEAIESLRSKIQKEKITVIETFVGPAENMSLPNNSLDIAFMAMVLHDFSDPLEVLKRLKTSLKPTGIIYNYDWKKQQSPKGPPYEIRLSIEDVMDLAKKVNLKVIANYSYDQDFYVVKLSR